MASGTVGRLTGRLSGRRVLRGCREIADEVASVESDFVDLSDSALAALTGGFRARIAAGEDAFDLLIEAFAAVREASRRTLGLRHHDEQIMGGAAMAMGAVADMRDSEGKTLTCVLPAYLAALEGGAVHVITMDDRQAAEAARWMGPVYRALGIEAGLIGHDLETDARRAVYRADVVYGSADEIGYDVLRDELAWTPDELVLRGLDAGIVDDALHRFVLQGDTEFLISGPAGEDVVERRTAWAGVAGSLSLDAGDYAVHRETRSVRLLPQGVDRLQDLLGVDELRPVEDAVELGVVAAVLRAREFGTEEPDPAGNVRLARITGGGLLRAYGTLSGASAGAAEQSEVFQRLYGMTVVPIPSRRPEGEESGWIVEMDRYERQATASMAVDLQRAERAAERAAIMPGGEPVAVDGLFGEYLEMLLHGLPRSLGRDDVEHVLARIGDTYPISVTADELVRAPRRSAVMERLRADMVEAYGRRERELGAELAREMERRVLLAVTDRGWREHLARADALPGSLSLLGSGEPGEESMTEAYLDAVADSHLMMRELIVEDVVGYLFHIELDPEEPEDA
ncbi:hypothetical protein [Actinomadura rugatobispora]|uniref:SecA family profile domain-containing protein n=1 Tax=Actinomadura rugatobispora TaxID=1994 RepID=A0ABW0ZS68_9ACTN|nr:hypothetical protein GCM10010200_076800 [Actinomadura rugatobispora]